MNNKYKVVIISDERKLEIADIHALNITFSFCHAGKLHGRITKLEKGAGLL